MYQIYKENHDYIRLDIDTQSRNTKLKWNSFSEDLTKEDMGHDISQVGTIGRMFPENDKVEFDL